MDLVQRTTMLVSLGIWENVYQEYHGSFIYYLCYQALSAYVGSGVCLCSLGQKPDPCLRLESYGCELDQMAQTLGISVTVPARALSM